MPHWLKVIWIIVTIISGVSVMWFLLGVTANFQRSVDLVGRFSFVLYWIPLVVLVILSTWVLFKRWTPPGVIGYGIAGLVIILQLLLSLTLFDSVNTDGWMKERIEFDPYQVTADGEVKYRLEIVNHHQKNGYEQLRVINVLSGEEQRITLKIGMEQSTGISIGGEDWSWITMNPTDTDGQYILSTTRDLGVPKKLFLIDLLTGTAQNLK